MKRLLAHWLVVLVLVSILGCSKKEEESATTTPPEAPAPPVAPVPPSTNVATLTPTQSVDLAPRVPPTPPPAAPPTPIAAPAFPQAPPNPFPRLTELTNQFLAANAPQSDPGMASLGAAVARITTIFALTVPDNTNAHGRLEVALEQLTKGQDVEALRALDSLKDTQLQPEQTRVARAVKGTVAAYVVQKNFSTLPGAGNEMAQIVSAVRQGDPNTAVHALHKVTSATQLTPQQKAVLDELVAEYAPNLSNGTTTSEEK